MVRKVKRSVEMRTERKLFNTEKFVSTNITGDLMSHFVLRMRRKIRKRRERGQKKTEGH